MPSPHIIDVHHHFVPEAYKNALIDIVRVEPQIDRCIPQKVERLSILGLHNILGPLKMQCFPPVA